MPAHLTQEGHLFLLEVTNDHYPHTSGPVCYISFIFTPNRFTWPTMLSAKSTFLIYRSKMEILKSRKCKCTYQSQCR